MNEEQTELFERIPVADSMQGRAEERILRHLYTWEPLDAETIAYDLYMDLIDVKLCIGAMRNRKWLEGNAQDGYELSFRFAWMDLLAQ